MIVNLLSGIIRNARNRRAAENAQTQALNTLTASKRNSTISLTASITETT